MVWFRKDLRLEDHPALLAALSDGLEIIPIFIWDPKAGDIWRPGEASRWWLHQSLLHLRQSINRLGGSILFLIGKPQEILSRICRDYGATALFYGRCYEPSSLELESSIETIFSASGIRCQSFNSNLLQEPWEVSNQSGSPYRVFTPYWRSARASVYTPPLAYTPSSLSFARLAPTSLESLNLLPENPWHKKLMPLWDVSRSGAKVLMNRLHSDIAPAYHSRGIPPLMTVLPAWRLTLHGAISVLARFVQQSLALIHKITSWWKTSFLHKLAGGNFPIIYYIIFHTFLMLHFGKSTPGFLGGMTLFPLTHGNRGRLDILLWMQACGSYGQPDGCTTVCAWSWHLFLLNIFYSLGGTGLVGFGTPWLMQIWQITLRDGNGQQVVALMPPLISEFSIQPGRVRNLIPKGAIFASGCQS